MGAKRLEAGGREMIGSPLKIRGGGGVMSLLILTAGGKSNSLPSLLYKRDNAEVQDWGLHTLSSPDPSFSDACPRGEYNFNTSLLLSVQTDLWNRVSLLKRDRGGLI